MRYAADVQAQVENQVQQRLAEAMQGMNLGAAQSSDAQANNVDMNEESKDEVESINTSQKKFPKRHGRYVPGND